jgi:dihydrofolate reductase
MPDQTNVDATATRKVVLLMGMGLDGYGAEGWLPPVTRGKDVEEVHDEVRRQLASVDTFLFGRVSFELWQDVWPALADNPRSSAFEKEFSRLTDRMHKVVYSHTLKAVTWQNSRLVNGSLADDVARMKRTPGGDLAIVGGPRIAHAFGELGLIDEYRLWIHPTIIGSGTPLLGSQGTPRDLDIIHEKSFGPGGLSLHLRPKPER